MATEQEIREACYLGADAALAAATWFEMSESDATSILEDIDPMVLDNYEPPSLSGEMGGESIPEIIFSDFDDPWDSALHDAWEDGRDQVFNDAREAVALRTLGKIGAALRVERANERRINRLRDASFYPQQS